MAVLTIAFTGVSLVARDAQPGDPLWGLTRVLYSDHAQSVEAAVAVNSDLDAARAALREGKVNEAKDALDKAGVALPKVSADDGHVDLSQKHTALLDELISTTPTTPGAPQTTTKKPKPTKTRDSTTTNSPDDTTSVDTSSSTPGGCEIPPPPPPPDPTDESGTPAAPLKAPPAVGAGQGQMDIFQQIDREKELLQPGRVAFEGPDSMRIDEAQRVTVSVSATAVDITSTMPGLAPVHISSFNIGPQVQAVLSGSGFVITSADENDDGRRRLSSNDSAQWSWHVTPLRSGALQLDLVLRAWTAPNSAPAVSQLAAEHTMATYPVTVESSTPHTAEAGTPQRSTQMSSRPVVLTVLALLLAIMTTYVLVLRQKGSTNRPRPLHGSSGEDVRSFNKVDTGGSGQVVQAGSIGMVILRVNENEDPPPTPTT